MIERLRIAGLICIMIFCWLLTRQGESVESHGKSHRHTELKKQIKDYSNRDTKPARLLSTCMDVESMCPAQMQQMPGKSFLLPKMWESLEWE